MVRRLSLALAVACCVVLLRQSLLPAHAQGQVTIYLPLITAGSGAPGAPTQPSEVLIDQAEAAGTITHEQALMYKVYALFGDSRLPAQFNGAETEDSQIMFHLRAEWNALSAGTRANLAPFLLPPNAPGSWPELATVSGQGVGAQAIEWRNVLATSGVRVWYQTRFAGDDVKAAGVAAAIDGRIFTVLLSLMGRTWLPDGGYASNGGDPLLDIYLVQGAGIGYLGLTTPYGGCEETAAWVNLKSDRPLGDDTTRGIVQTATHEMMHTIQFTYPLSDACSTYDWLAEATAKWSEHLTYPHAQSEQPYAPSYLNTAYWPLENTTGQRWYGAYLYPFFVTETQGRPTPSAPCGRTLPAWTASRP